MRLHAWVSAQEVIARGISKSATRMLGSKTGVLHNQQHPTIEGARDLEKDHPAARSTIPPVETQAAWSAFVHSPQCRSWPHDAQCPQDICGRSWATTARQIKRTVNLFLKVYGGLAGETQAGF